MPDESCEKASAGLPGMTTTDRSSKVAESLTITAEAWLTIKSIGACAYCAARIAGCNDQAVYTCAEDELEAEINARFMKYDGASGVQCRRAPKATTGILIPRCTLCLGLLQTEAPLLLAPRARPSGESRGDGERSCEVSRADEGRTAPTKGPKTAEDTEEQRLTTAEIGLTKGMKAGDQYRSMPLGWTIVECAKARGYTVSNFCIAASLPACLAVRDASFLEFRNHALGYTSDTEHGDVSVTVKDALKMSLGGSLESGFGVSQDSKADFVVELTAKAPKADAHALELLTGSAPSQSGAKSPGWPGSGRWAKKRRRREEQKNPGLTVGLVKKALSNLTDDVKDRMRQWVEGLRAGVGVAGDPTDGMREEVEGSEPTVRHGIQEMREGECTVGEDLVGSVELSQGEGEGDAQPEVAGAAPHTKLDVRTSKSSDAHAETGGDRHHATEAEDLRCDIVIRRHSLHFWGRYTKLSRSVPQTPWMRGFFSVQEAISEPFEAFSGCVEGIIHGAGREDMDVRMLGNGRPFSLELIDSLRSEQEITAQLGSLAQAINNGKGRKNDGGAVAVKQLRPAGPEDLPGEVQKVGEEKRKHYRCIVWVSKAVTEQELTKMCNRPELLVQQSTPLRVLHRRTLLDRPKSIFDMRAEWINNHFFILDLKTSAGTYVKEFVHGDLGRTVPSIGSLLGCRADILQLDVTHIEDKWTLADQAQG